MTCFITAATESDIARLEELRDVVANPGQALQYAAEYDALPSLCWLLSNYKVWRGTHLLQVCEDACNHKASAKVLECLLNAVLNTWSWSKIRSYLAEHWDEADITRMNEVYDQMNLKLWWGCRMMEQSPLPDDVVRQIVRI